MSIHIVPGRPAPLVRQPGRRLWQGEQLLAQVPADAYPSLARVASELLASGFDYADEFEFGLVLILEAVGPLLPGA